MKHMWFRTYCFNRGIQVHALKMVVCSSDCKFVSKDCAFSTVLAGLYLIMARVAPTHFCVWWSHHCTPSGCIWIYGIRSSVFSLEYLKGRASPAAATNSLASQSQTKTTYLKSAWGNLLFQEAWHSWVVKWRFRNERRFLFEFAHLIHVVYFFGLFSLLAALLLRWMRVRLDYHLTLGSTHQFWIVENLADLSFKGRIHKRVQAIGQVEHRCHTC